MRTPMTRRRFVGNVAASLFAATLPRLAFGDRPRGGPSWKIGVLSRPWSQWTFDEMLGGAQGAGFELFGYLTPTKGDTYLGADGSEEYLDSLKQRVAAAGLTPVCGRIGTRERASEAENIADLRKQIDNAAKLGVGVVMHTGTMRSESFGQFYRLMTFAAAYAQDAGIEVVTKPHGGVNAAAAELTRCLEEIDHPNFKIWYDAANIIYYTGKDPVEELKPIASHVTGFCAKDCAGLRSDVMIPFGAGKVDFAAVFRSLKQAGFDGPLMIETCEVDENSLEQTTANAKANRLFLERVLAAI